jgi:anti-sigma regulatory factor (Ser/Thr protein kinase)
LLDRGAAVEGDLGALSGARSLVRSTLGGFPPDLVETAVLLADELISNAVRHGGGRFTLTVGRRRGDGVRLAVGDRSPARPTVRHPGPGAETGRGMRLVAALASRWGVETRPPGKVVWVELDP